MKTLGMAGLVALPVVCCAGLPLLLAAGVSVGLASWIGGIAVGGVVLLGAAAVLGLRVRRAPVNSSVLFQPRGVARERP